MPGCISKTIRSVSKYGWALMRTRIGSGLSPKDKLKHFSITYLVEFIAVNWYLNVDKTIINYAAQNTLYLKKRHCHIYTGSHMKIENRTTDLLIGSQPALFPKLQLPVHQPLNKPNWKNNLHGRGDKWYVTEENNNCLSKKKYHSLQRFSLNKWMFHLSVIIHL